MSARKRARLYAEALRLVIDLDRQAAGSQSVSDVRCLLNGAAHVAHIALVNEKTPREGRGAFPSAAGYRLPCVFDVREAYQRGPLEGKQHE